MVYFYEDFSRIGGSAAGVIGRAKHHLCLVARRDGFAMVREAPFVLGRGVCLDRGSYPPLRAPKEYSYAFMGGIYDFLA